MTRVIPRSHTKWTPSGVLVTGKIDELFNHTHGRLPYRSLDLKFKRLGVEWFQEAATINYPNDYDFTRITEFKHLHPTESKKTVILREYPCTHDEGNDPYYPLFTEESRRMYEEYRKLAEEIEGLTLLGRLAEYRYYDMDDVVKRALEVFEGEIM